MVNVWCDVLDCSVLCCKVRYGMVWWCVVCSVVWCSVSHCPTPDAPCADDQLTPNDEDPVAAVTTGSLLGEKDERMIELKILKSEPHEVCVCVCV